MFISYQNTSYLHKGSNK